MSFAHTPDEPDALRQNCIQILRHYTPESKQKKWLNFADLRTTPTDPVKAKKEFRANNEKYVNALKGVMKAGKEAAIQKNLQAHEKFLQSLIAKPPKVESPVPESQTSAKRKSPTSLPRRVLKRCKQEPDTQSLESTESQVCESPSLYLPCLNQNLPCASNQLEPIDSPKDVYPESISSSLFFPPSFQQSTSLYCPFSQIANESDLLDAAEQTIFLQQSALAYTNNLCTLQPSTADSDSQQDSFNFFSYLYL